MLIYFIILIISKIIIYSFPCIEDENNCSLCNPITKLCFRCQKNFYTPDKNGGCQFKKKCEIGINHCFQCQEKKDLCLVCEEGYYPDENGGCSYTDNCEFSENGLCLKCKKNFILIGKDNDLKLCKFLNSEDFQNCTKINKDKGICEICEKNYYLNSIDKKCSSSQKCSNSINGICIKCDKGYYLNKIDNKCYEQKTNFVNCKESFDGENCNICEEGYFFDENKKCIEINYCLKKSRYNNCKICHSDYFHTEYDKICTKEKNCYSGNKEFGICEICKENYYLDLNDFKCKSNQEGNEFKYCKESKNNICNKCINNYYLGKDHKCSYSKNCEKSLNGYCIKCEEKYHLGNDNKCTNIEHCIETNYFIFDECTECENNYYYDKYDRMCKEAKNNLTNCKYGYEYCLKCKNDFYLNSTDNLCYSNKEEGIFYKCAHTDFNASLCNICIDDYYLGFKDKKCTKNNNCDLSENENRCIECSENYCLNLKNGKCYNNEEINKDEEKKYYRCIRTNKEGTKCEICNEGLTLDENGLCVDNIHCIIKKDNTCQKCLSDEYNFFCLNNKFGCIEINSDNCLECNDIFDFSKCTKCLEGYELDEYDECVEIENESNR